jgi:transcriptional regulator with XRE-family HTH domain
MQFNEKLQELRRAAGLTQIQLAEASGLPLGSLRGYEQGQREPPWTVVFKLATALAVSVEAFADCVDVQAKDARALDPIDPERACGPRPASTRPAPKKTVKKRKGK